MNSVPDFRASIRELIRKRALPVDKYSHQPRVYARARALAGTDPFDDDILFAAAWLHDIGVFIGIRPENPAELVHWDNVAYAAREVPGLLRQLSFPEEKIAPVIDAIQNHLPKSRPAHFEGVLLHDADILEQLGAVGILRTVSKVGRDTRFTGHGDAVNAVKRAATELFSEITLPHARDEAKRRIALMEAFLASLEEERLSVDL